MVDFHDERNPVRVFAGHRPQHAVGGGHRVAAAFHRQLLDVLRVKVIRILRKTRAAGVLDPLVHRQNRNIPRARQPAMAEQPLQVPQHAVVPVRHRKGPVHEIRAGQVQPVLRDFRVLEVEQIIGLVAEQFCDLLHN